MILPKLRVREQWGKTAGLTSDAYATEAAPGGTVAGDRNGRCIPAAPPWSSSLGLYKTLASGPPDGGNRGVCRKLLQNPVAVACRGLEADLELVGDVPGRTAVGNEPKHFHFAGSEHVDF